MLLKGVKVKEDTFNLNNLDSSQHIINSTLLHNNGKIKFLNVAGEWNVELKYLGKLILFKKFLVLPKKTVFESKWLKLVNKYWSFDSICVKSIENIQTNQTYSHGKMLKNFMENGAEWSTFYPDPESDIDNLGIDYKFRKFENSCEKNQIY